MKTLLVVSLTFLVSTASAALELPAIPHQQTYDTVLSHKAHRELATLVGGRPDRTAGSISNTGSMCPLLDEGYIVVLEKRRFKELKPSDIALRTGSWSRSPILHRLQKKSFDGWTTKGDSLRTMDPAPMDFRDYLGWVAIAAIHKTSGNVSYVERARESSPHLQPR